MAKSKSNASNNARCRSPSQLISIHRIRARTTSGKYEPENGPEMNKVETASRACGSSATKFYTGNNRERRLVISAL